jgi:4-hydroxybenzoate polyprenyltransferase
MSTASSRIVKLLEISRPGLWLVFMWLYLWPTGGSLELLSSLPFWAGLLYVTFPLNLLVYGMNDLVDEDVDKDNPRKGNFIYGAKVTRSDRVNLPATIFLVNFLPLLALGYLTGETLYVCAWLMGAFAINYLYNNKPFQFSRRFPYEVPTMIVGHFMIPILSSHINGLPVPTTASWLFNGLLLARSHIWLEYADIACDLKECKRTFAVVFGAKIAFRTVIALTVLESIVATFLLESTLLGLFSLFGVVVFSLSAKDGGVKEEKVHVSVSQSLVGAALMIYVWHERIFVR